MYLDSNNDGVPDTWRELPDSAGFCINPIINAIGMCKGPLAKTMRINQEAATTPTSTLGGVYVELKRVSTHDRGRG
jgi:hypothetical protein